MLFFKISNNIKSHWQKTAAMWLIRGLPFFMILVTWFWFLPMFTFGHQLDNNSSTFGKIIQYVPKYTAVNNMLVISIWELITMIYIVTFLTLASKVVSGKYFKGSAIVLQILLLAAICNSAYMLGKIVFVRWQLSNVEYIALNENSMDFLNGRDYERIINKPTFSGNESQIVCVNKNRCYLPKTDKIYMTYNGFSYFFLNDGIMHQGGWHIKIESGVAYVKNLTE